MEQRANENSVQKVTAKRASKSIGPLDKEFDAAQEIGSHARSGTPRDAVNFADVLLLAVPWGEVKDALSAAGAMNGKTFISCVNPFGLRGLEVGLNTSSAQEISRFVPDAPVVEAFNYNRRLIQEAGRKVDRT
ncbi:MAG: hypothetical protein DMG17_25520 [Acidobacteria bacterium]|nr:MAG: hypothetical protein DMG20_14230 [Acidobacteriota bacterium]PYS10106.1 MAG: hypothetical protein DMG17_25520 [Acidobacteriota bacterium]